MKKWAIVLIGALLLGSAWADNELKRTPSAEGAAVGFSNVQDGSVVPPVFTVRFSIAGMGVAPAGMEIENTGHHHLLIDIEELPNLDQPLPATDQIIHFGKGQSETELQLSEGAHTLQLLLADYRHIPHDPPVLSERITITVETGAPEPVEPEK
jgi:hypothetical protein